MKIKVKKLHQDAQLPTYGSDGAACFDLYALEDTSATRGRIAVRTGLAVEVPVGYEMVIRPRSGLAFKHGMQAFSGTIDSDYRGEIKVLMIGECSATGLTVKGGDRIAQAVIQPVLRVEFEQADELSDTVRGDGGFGSTGDK